MQPLMTHLMIKTRCSQMWHVETLLLDGAFKELCKQVYAQSPLCLVVICALFVFPVSCWLGLVA